MVAEQQCACERAAAEGAVGAARLVLTASHDVMALRLQPLGQMATGAGEGGAVAQVSASPMQATLSPTAAFSGRPARPVDCSIPDAPGDEAARAGHADAELLLGPVGLKRELGELGARLIDVGNLGVVSHGEWAAGRKWTVQAVVGTKRLPPQRGAAVVSMPCKRFMAAPSWHGPKVSCRLLFDDAAVYLGGCGASVQGSSRKYARDAN